MTYKETLNYIHSIPRFSKTLGTKKMGNLLDKLGNPEKQLKFVHVAGTNGKGSTCTMLSYVLKNAGYKTGLYISPFIIDFRERIQVDNQMISENNLVKITSKVKTAWEELKQEGEPPSELEVVLAVALLYYVETSCDIVILEVGIGGKFDATNIIPSPLVTAITSVNIDHADILGDTIAKIAHEKVGIIKEDTIVVSYPKQPIEALEVIMEACGKKNVPLIIPHNAEILSYNLSGSEFIYSQKRYFVSLPGKHQVYNALVVIEAAVQLTQRGFAITDNNIMTGIKETRFPARIEVISKEPLIILDGAHNVDGAHILANALEMVNDKKLIGIMGIIKSKAADEVIEQLSNSFSKIIITLDPTNKEIFFDVKELADMARKKCDDVSYAYEPIEAIKEVLKNIKPNEAIVVCGSLFLASYVRNNIHKIIDYRGDKPL